MKFVQTMTVVVFFFFFFFFFYQNYVLQRLSSKKKCDHDHVCNQGLHSSIILHVNLGFGDFAVWADLKIKICFQKKSLYAFVGIGHVQCSGLKI